MRFLFGLLIGIALTLGAAYVHDINIAPPLPPSVVADASALPPAAPRRIVNWDVLDGIVDAQATFVRETWNKIFR